MSIIKRYALCGWYHSRCDTAVVVRSHHWGSLKFYEIMFIKYMRLYIRRKTVH